MYVHTLQVPQLPTVYSLTYTYIHTYTTTYICMYIHYRCLSFQQLHIYIYIITPYTVCTYTTDASAPNSILTHTHMYIYTYTTTCICMYIHYRCLSFQQYTHAYAKLKEYLAGSSPPPHIYSPVSK